MRKNLFKFNYFTLITIDNRLGIEGNGIVFK